MGALKISLAFVGATGVVGGGVLVHKLVSNNTKIDVISNYIKAEYLLTNDHPSQWSHRLDLLNKAIDSDLSKGLLAKKKSKVTLTVDDLKGWCASSLKEEFLGKEDTKFMNVRLYCGINIGDRITGNKVSSSTTNEDKKLKAKFSSLSGKTEVQLVRGLFSIKGTENTASPWNGSKALKDWCLKSLNLPFEEGLIYTNTQEYCTLP